MHTKKNSIAIRTLLIAGLLGVSCVKGTPDTPEDPGVVRMDGELGYEVIDAQGSEVLARLHIGTEDVSGMRRPPLNLALVLDTSGSMMGEPIERVKEAARDIVGTLRDDDHLSVVTFHSGVDVVLANTEVGDVDVDELNEAIDAIEASGTTMLAPGLATGIQQIASWTGEGNELRRIVLLGDGVPNSPTAVLPQAVRAAQMQTPITTLGLGLEYDEVLMGQIAQTSGGTFTYVEEADAVLAVFRREVTRLEQTLARGMQLRLNPGPGVELVEVVGHPQATNGGAVALNLGDLTAGQEWSIVVKMTAPQRQAGALVELLDANLTFTDAFAEAGALERKVFLGARASEDPAAIEASRNDAVHTAAAEVEAASELLAAIQMVRDGNPAAAVHFENAAESYERAGPAYRERAASVRRTGSVAFEDDAPAAAAAINAEHEAAMDSVGY
ncbi:MAG: VWA domain-containing protein [Deltaproteobacteria bacterium]|nr:VWA domain-containing protein [Deltaproteobacteria bacterium]